MQQLTWCRRPDKARSAVAAVTVHAVGLDLLLGAEPRTLCCADLLCKRACGPAHTVVSLRNAADRVTALTVPARKLRCGLKAEGLCSHRALLGPLSDRAV